MDTFTPSQRSERMSRVRGKDTKPELIIRRLLHGMGYRYRLHRKDLPGKPDLVFPSRRKVVWIHGCYWHRHDGCKLARLPKSRLEFWGPKLEANKVRDSINQQAIIAMGWNFLVVWECELRNKKSVAFKIQDFLDCEEPHDHGSP